MELKEIQQLIKFVSSSGVDEVELERKDFKLRIRKNEHKTEIISVPQQVSPASIPVAPAPLPTPVVNAPVEAPKTEQPASSNLIEIKSPMIGTFYRSPSPDKPAFVNVGDEVKIGQVICIVEAMKLFNEIESEVSGRIVKVVANDASPVEYDQVLFLVEPS
ncbi:MAG: acetyl-CoA carboxylase biotin carboxyl carrier protein [Flavobacteriales bacterium]|nr:acetyl-CoA carboxylase biotin carboxyl carrier protein [Flavobacteriales bacterium]